MAVKLNDMKSRTKPLVVQWDDERVDLSYYPNVVTPELLEDVDAAAKEENLNILGVLLEPVLEWWDVLDDDGQRLPTSREYIRQMPMSFLNKVQDAIQAAQNPPASGSSAGS